jgi:hypothetical protein
VFDSVDSTRAALHCDEAQYSSARSEIEYAALWSDGTLHGFSIGRETGGIVDVRPMLVDVGSPRHDRRFHAFTDTAKRKGAAVANANTGVDDRTEHERTQGPSSLRFNGTMMMSDDRSCILFVRWQMSVLICRDDRVIVARLGDAAVLLHVDRGHYYSLNAVGARIWELLDTPQRAQDMEPTLFAEFDVSAAALSDDLRAFLDALEARGLVRTVSTTET